MHTRPLILRTSSCHTQVQHAHAHHMHHDIDTTCRHAATYPNNITFHYTTKKVQKKQIREKSQKHENYTKSGELERYTQYYGSTEI